MRLRTLLFVMPPLLVVAPANAQDLNWEFKSTEARIQLVMADDSHVALEATPIKPARSTRGNASSTVYFEVRGDTSDRPVSGSPIYIDLGSINPKSLANPINLVKLEKKGGLRTWVMKVVGSDFFPALANEIIPLAQRPKPVQAADGSVTLTLPMVLPPGEYAIFTDVEAWEFTVKAN